MESRGIDANFSFSNRFVPHSRTRTSGKQRLESRRGRRKGGGWPCVGSRTAIPDMAISHNERQWCPRLETQRGRQLINSPSLVCYAEFSRPAPPRFGSVIAITRTIIWGIKKHGSGCFSVRMERVGVGWRIDSRLGDEENEFEESKKGINVDCWNCFWEIGSRLWGNNCKWFLNEWQWKMMAIKRDRWRKSKKFWNSVEIVL